MPSSSAPKVAACRNGKWAESRKLSARTPALTAVVNGPDERVVDRVEERVLVDQVVEWLVGEAHPDETERGGDPRGVDARLGRDRHVRVRAPG
jgi:hypothetical protein